MFVKNIPVISLIAFTDVIVSVLVESLIQQADSIDDGIKVFVISLDSVSNEKLLKNISQYTTY